MTKVPSNGEGTKVTRLVDFHQFTYLLIISFEMQHKNAPGLKSER